VKGKKVEEEKEDCGECNKENKQNSQKFEINLEINLKEISDIANSTKINNLGLKKHTKKHTHTNTNPPQIHTHGKKKKNYKKKRPAHDTTHRNL